MAKVIIYQVLGEYKKYEEVTYTIDNKPIPTPSKFSSLALREYYKNDKNEQVENVFIYPISLYENISSTQNWYQNIEDIKKSVAKSLTNQSVTKNSILILESIGKYRTGIFKGSYDNIMLAIYFDMIRRCKNSKKIVIDVSTSHNIYIAPFIEAIKNFKAWHTLFYGFNPEYECQICIAYSEPITKSENDTFNIYEQIIDSNIFFELPIKIDDICGYVKLESWIKGLTDTEKEKFSKEYKKFKQCIKEFLKNLAMTFNAIKYNIPLIIYYIDLNLDVIARINEFTLILDNFMLKPVNKDQQKHFEFYKVDKNKAHKILLSLALYNGIIELLKRYDVYKQNISDNDGLSLSEIKKFIQLYKNEKIGLETNERFLNKEINEIEEQLKDKIQGTFQSFSKIKYGNDEERKSADAKRNFFAHCGFEENFVEIKKIDGDIKIRYKKENIENIKEFIKSPK